MKPIGSIRIGARSASLLAILVLAVSLGACAKPKAAAKPAASNAATAAPPAGEPAVSDTHISYCRTYADQMAGRELQREYDSMEGRFRGSESRVFRDFAKMDAQKNYRRIYENCIRSRAAREGKSEDGAASK